MSQFDDLRGKVAVITGGSRGLGRAMASGLASQGTDVVIASRKEDACIEVAESIAAEFGTSTLAVRFHAGKWDDSQHLADAVYERFGRCDVLINNAGMSPVYPSLTEISEDLFDKVVGVNFKGPFRLSSVIGARMAAAGSGSIINISSTASVRPQEHQLVYASAKAALNALTIGLCRAYGPAVRANAIMPGAFQTDISTAWDPSDVDTKLTEEIPLKRLGDPSEIVGAALYLASGASSYTSGAILKVDGGFAFSPA